MELYEDDISNEDLVEELQRIEEEKEDKIEEDDYSYEFQTDAFRAYHNDIGRYPLLTVEEEQKYGIDLKYGNQLSIVDRKTCNRITIYTLNRDKVLSYLANSKMYMTTLNLLLSELKKINNKNDKSLIETLDKYKRLCLLKKRNLTPLEIEDYFGVSDKVINIYSDLEFFDEVKKFFIYRNARDKMFHSNLRLVVGIAKRYSSIDPMDLISEGNFGLMRAIDRYDVDLGFKFSTYATWWIKESIKRSIGNNKNLIRIPVNYMSNLIKYKNAVELLKSELGREPTDEEISKELGLSLRAVRLYQAHMYRFVSLEQPIGADDGMKIGDIIEDSNKIEDKLVKNSLANEIRDILDEMEQSGEITKRDRNIVEMLYGFDDYLGYPRTAVEVSKEVNIPISRVKSIQSKTLRKIRCKSRIRHSKYGSLTDYLD